MPRLSQRDILPVAVKRRGLDSNIVRVSDTGSVSVTLNNGDSTSVTLLGVNNRGATFIAEPEFSIYQTSITEANLLPFGSGVDASEFQIIGPWNEWTGIDGGLFASADFDTAADEPIS